MKALKKKKVNSFSYTFANVAVMSDIIYLFILRKTPLQALAIFSEKSHQRGHDLSLNPLISATRSLNTREKKAGPSPLGTEYTFSFC